jgi:hypothetical protein
MRLAAVSIDVEWLTEQIEAILKNHPKPKGLNMEAEVRDGLMIIIDVDNQTVLLDRDEAFELLETIQAKLPEMSCAMNPTPSQQES